MSTPAEDGLSRADIEALGATRKDLGPDYEAALLDGFADKVEAAIESRVSAELERRNDENWLTYDDGKTKYKLPMPGTKRAKPAKAAGRAGGGQQLALAISSLVALIPISIVLSINSQLFALIITLAAIVGVNIAHAWFYRGQDD